MTMWPDKLIISALSSQRGSSSAPPIAWVPEERVADYGQIADSQVQPASLDVRLGGEFILQPSGELVRLDPYFAFSLVPGQCVLATLVERICIPDNVVARIEGKSTWARKFLTVHSAGFIDPGFTGDVTLELKNDGPHRIEMKPGDAIAQLSFQWLAAPAIRPYGSEGIGSHYQGQKGANGPWF